MKGEYVCHGGDYVGVGQGLCAIGGNYLPWEASLVPSKVGVCHRRRIWWP